MASAEKGERLRRLVHILTSSFILYYWIPPYIAGVNKEYWLMILLAVVLFMDSYRMHAGWRVFGAREYEHNRPSALALVAIGVTIGFLFFPKYLVVPAILTMAFVDPLIRSVRGNRYIYPVLPACFAIFIFYTSFTYLVNWSVTCTAVFAVIGGGAAIAAERPHLTWIDDDILMILVPMIILYIIS